MVLPSTILGGGDAATVADAHMQASHGFVVGNVVCYTASGWFKAQANNLITACAEGVVSAVIDANNFTITYSGYISGLSGLTAGTLYYLSRITAGAVVSAEPSPLSVPIFKALSTTEAVISIKRLVNTPTSSTAALFVSANSEWLSAANVAAIQAGNIDISVAGWAYLNSKSSLQGLFTKWRNSTNNREYAIYYNNTSDRFQATLSTDGIGGGGSPVSANTLGSPAINTWYFIVFWHDATADTMNIEVNRGTADSIAHVGGIFVGTSDLNLGAFNNGADSFADAREQSWGYWKNDVLSVSEKDELYNLGDGVYYPSLSAGIKTNLSVFYNLSETSGGRTDSHSAVNLTDNNTVGSAAGVPNI
jgi:hypothetical protein